MGYDIRTRWIRKSKYLKKSKKTTTDRTTNNYKFKSNLVHHTLYELRHLYGDLLYQIFRRWDRLCDPFQKYVLPSSLISLYLLSHQHIAFLVNLFVTFRMVLFTCFSQVSLEYLAKQKSQKLMKCKNLIF
jgi:hypothetical protein